MNFVSIDGVNLIKKQWIHNAQKDWDSTDGHDMNEKNRIAQILRDSHIRHYPLFDQTIFINKQTFKWQQPQPKNHSDPNDHKPYNSKEDLWRDWEVFMPDLLFPMKNLIIEIDGLWHFNTAKGVKQTNKRNEYYEYAGIRLIWFTAAQIKGWSDAELHKELTDRL